MYRRRVSLGLLSAALGVAGLHVQGLAQTPQPPTFRGTVDLLTLDASVRDKRGVPVPDLQPSDFTVTIDGRPRQVVSAVFFAADPAAGSRLRGGAAPTPRHVSNDASMPGRVIVFALDAQSIRGGQERALFDTASGMLEGLSAADAVGLVELPGPAIDVTRDHSAVKEALTRFRGRARTEAEIFAEGRNIRLTDRAHTQQVHSRHPERSNECAPRRRKGFDVHGTRGPDALRVRDARARRAAPGRCAIREPHDRRRRQ